MNVSFCVFYQSNVYQCKVCRPTFPSGRITTSIIVSHHTSTAHESKLTRVSLCSANSFTQILPSRGQMITQNLPAYESKLLSKVRRVPLCSVIFSAVRVMAYIRCQNYILLLIILLCDIYIAFCYMHGLFCYLISNYALFILHFAT